MTSYQHDTIYFRHEKTQILPFPEGQNWPELINTKQQKTQNPCIHGIDHLVG